MRTPSEQAQKNPVISEDIRLRVITLLAAFLGVTTMAPTGLSGGGTIPMCKDMRSHKSPEEPPFLDGKEAEGKVICVVDGDTFDVKLDDGPMARVRLWGVDCPESSFNDKCMKNSRSDCAEEVAEGKKASQRVQLVLNGNERVTLEPPYKNNGNRLLAYVRLQNGIDFGRLLVKSCLCSAEYDHKRKKDYQQAAHNCSR
jgi:endonuclease YncB( thermonuclease family)